MVRPAWRALALAVTLGFAPTAAHAARHPIHSTLTQITQPATGGPLQVSIRVFADDFAAAVARHSGAAPRPDHRVDDSAAVAYLASAFALHDGAGRPVPLAWCGARRTGDVVWLCLRGRAAAPSTGFHVTNRLHSELYADQINIVQALLDGRRSSVLFTARDRTKPLG